MTEIKKISKDLREATKLAKHILDALMFNNVEDLINIANKSNSEHLEQAKNIMKVLMSDKEKEQLGENFRTLFKEYFEKMLSEFPDSKVVVSEVYYNVYPNLITIKNKDIVVLEIRLAHGCLKSHYEICLEYGMYRIVGLEQYKQRLNEVEDQIKEKSKVLKDNHPKILGLITKKTIVQEDINYLNEHLEENIVICRNLIKILNNYGFVDGTNLKGTEIHKKITEENKTEE